MATKFKAKLYSGRQSPLADKSRPLEQSDYYLKFSKNKIYFTDKAFKKAGHLTNSLDPFNDGREVRHTDTYELVKVEPDSIHRLIGSKFRVRLNTGKEFNIATKWNDTFLMYWLHNRTWLQKNFDKLTSGLITTIFTIAGSVATGLITYDLGFNAGLKAGQDKQKPEQKDTTKVVRQESTQPKSTHYLPSAVDTTKCK